MTLLPRFPAKMTPITRVRYLVLSKSRTRGRTGLRIYKSLLQRGQKMTRKKERRRGPQSPLIFSACYLTRSPPSERHALQSKRPEEASTTAHRQLMGLH